MTNNEKKYVLTASKCPLCGGKCSIPTSYGDGIEPPKDFDDDKGGL